MSTVLKGITLADYEARERVAELKSEYYRGEMFAMAGGSVNHSLISNNISGELRQVLKDRPCHVFNSDLRIKIEETGLYTYPDVSVVCGPLRYDANVSETVTNPILLVEVLSESSESYDRGVKASHYRKIDSLQVLMLVSQKSPSVETLVRQPDGAWLLREVSNLEDAVHIGPLDIWLAMKEIYRGVLFNADSAQDN